MPINLPFSHNEGGISLPDVGLKANNGAAGVPSKVGQGIAGIKELANTIGSFLSLILGSIAILMLFVAGYKLVSAQSEVTEKAEEQKLNVVYILAGLVLTGLAGNIVYDYLFVMPTGGGGEVEIGKFIQDPEKAKIVGSAVALRIKQLLNLFLAFSGTGAILVLVIASLRMVINPGGEEEVEKQKKLVGYTALGIVIIGMADVLVNKIIFVEAGYRPMDVQVLEAQLQGLSNYVLGFLGVIIFVTFIISGIVVVANYGNTEVLDKVKTTIKNVVIGSLVTFSAYTIVATLIRTFLAA